MNKTTRQALEASIEHWEEILKDPGISWYGGSCPLCGVFEPHSFQTESCARHVEGEWTECPVRAKTGVPQCGGTPWTAYNDFMNLHATKELEARRQELAKAELEFLKSLR